MKEVGLLITMFAKARTVIRCRRRPIACFCQNARNLSGKKFQLAIFNQSGTLNCIDTLYAQWCENTSKTLSHFVGPNVSSDFFQVVGYDPIKNKFCPGGISEQPHHLMKQTLTDILEKKYHMDRLKMRSLVMDVWGHDIGGNVAAKRVKPIGQISKTLGRLKENGIKIAVCTTETRSDTSTILENLGVSRMIDIMMCGDDDAVFPKPHPSNVYAICAATGIRPSNTVVIGDTRTDMILGRKAKTGGVIGVLCGVGSHQDLEPFADIVIKNIEPIPDIYFGAKLKKDSFTTASCMSHSTVSTIQK